jgi:hypothetical protein
MADFPQLAAAMVDQIITRDDFVASSAVVDEGFDRPEQVSASPDAVCRLADVGRQMAEGSTNLYFLKGDPGAGKTTLLREATALQARRYLGEESDFLFFFVSAQGRELSNLRDAFSGELQDLRAGFTRDAISTLVRAGLLVPVVDGFDELLGTAGYGGAFSSLQSLLAELEGLGALAVSARSSFYDLEFLGRSMEAGQRAEFAVTTVSLEPWTDEQLHQYLDAQSDPQAKTALEALRREDKELLRRPFFASEFPGYIAQHQPDEADADDDQPLLDFLITAYIKRESAKIVDSNGNPVLPVDGHRRLFELAASEMWENETRHLPQDDLQTLTEIVAEEFELGTDEAVQLGTKVTSYAGFRSGVAGGRDEFAFEHEVYFDYFLARALSRLVVDGRLEELNQALDRAVISGTVATSAMGDALREAQLEPLYRCPAGIRYENRRRNSGSLLTAYARLRRVQGVKVEGLSFIDVSFAGSEFHDVSFVKCNFLGADFSDARFVNCEASSSSFHAIMCSNASQLGIHGLRPGRNFSSVRHDAAGDVYAPRDVQAVLERLGAPFDDDPPTQVYSDRARVYIELLQHVARAYRRTNIIYESDDAHLGFLHNQYWPDLRRLLLGSGVVTEEVRATSGPKTKALRLRVTVDQLLVGATGTAPQLSPASTLWAELRRVS